MWGCGGGGGSAVQPRSVGGVRGGEEGHTQEHTQERTRECCTYPLATYPFKSARKLIRKFLSNMGREQNFVQCSYLVGPRHCGLPTSEHSPLTWQTFQIFASVFRWRGRLKDRCCNDPSGAVLRDFLSGGKRKGGIPHCHERCNVCPQWCCDTQTVTRVRHHLLLLRDDRNLHNNCVTVQWRRAGCRASPYRHPRCHTNVTLPGYHCSQIPHYLSLFVGQNSVFYSCYHHRC